MQSPASSEESLILIILASSNKKNLKNKAKNCGSLRQSYAI
jgi:hypothetical protein